MSNNVTFQTTVVATPPGSTVVESIDEGGGVERQVVTLGGFGSTTTPETQLAPGTIATVRSQAGQITVSQIKGSAGVIFSWTLFNHATSARFVKFFNAAAAGVTPGVTVPIFKIGLAPGKEHNMDTTWGMKFTTAISYIITGGVDDLDTTPVALDDVFGEIQWL